MKTTLTQNKILDYKIQEYQDRIDELKDRNNELSNAVSNNKDYNAIYEIYENECHIEEYIEKIVELESKRKYVNMERENFITKDSRTAKDVDLVEDMFFKGYQLTQIVPRFYNDGSPIGYTYWFENIDLIK
jgi:seryl-tRNA synthetase